MLHNNVVKSIIFPWPSHTDVRIRANQTYNLNAPTYTGPPPRVVPANLAEGHYDYDMQDHISPHDSPPHNTPYFSNHDASTTSGHTAQLGPQDGHYVILYIKRQEMMAFMRDLHDETQRSHQQIIVAQITEVTHTLN